MSESSDHHGPSTASVVACTVVTAPYLPHAVSLADSLRAYHPEMPSVTLIVDREAKSFPPSTDRHQVLGLDALPIADPQAFRFRHPPDHLCLAAVPALLRTLLAEGYERAIYCAPETLVLAPLTPVLALLDQPAPLVITPGRDEPSAPYSVDACGAPCDVGDFPVLVAARDCSPLRALGEMWWRVLSPAGGVPRADVRVVRGAPYCRSLRADMPVGISARILDGGRPLLLDCRGVAPGTVPFDLGDAAPGAAETLFARQYAARLRARGFDEAPEHGSLCDFFRNGVPIPPIARAIYRDLGEGARRFGDPFATDAPTSYFHWLMESPDDSAALPIPRFWWLVYERSADLQRAYPDARGRDRAAFGRWIASIGAERYAAPPRFLRAVVVGLTAEESAGRAQPPPMPPATVPLGVNVCGHISSEKGVGEAVRSAIRILAAARVPFVVNDFTDPGSANIDRTVMETTGQQSYPINLIALGAGEVPWFARSLGQEYRRDRYTIGHVAWELEDFPAAWVQTLSFFDEVWVASDFIGDALRAFVTMPVATVPYTVVCDDTPVARPPLRHGIPADTYVFLYVFDFDSYVERKNPLGVIEAFKRAFTRSDDALLILKCVHSSVAPDRLRALQRASTGANIRITDHVMSRAQLRELFAAADCYVSLHRAEGFGLTVAEAMSLAKPVIATGYSGNMDFMTRENSYLCDYRLVPIARDAGPYQRGFVWADPDVEHAATLMRDVYEHRAHAAAIGERARWDIARSLTPAAVAARVRQRLGSQAIRQQRGSHRSQPDYRRSDS
jgi:glycosyltransferase involved in cell wall biosynthesis